MAQCRRRRAFFATATFVFPKHMQLSRFLKGFYKVQTANKLQLYLVLLSWVIYLSTNIFIANHV